LSCSISWRKIARALSVASIATFAGFFGLLLSVILIKAIFILLPSPSLAVAVLRFALSGAVILLWLYLWWKSAVYMRNRILSKSLAKASED